MFMGIYKCDHNQKIKNSEKMINIIKKKMNKIRITIINKEEITINNNCEINKAKIMNKISCNIKMKKCLEK